MSKSRLIGSVCALCFILGSNGNVWATSINPLDDGGWELVAHMSDSGGMFDGDGGLFSGYSYGIFDANPTASTADFQRVFPIVADEILFMTGDGIIWGIADYGDLLSLMLATGNDLTPQSRIRDRY